MTRVIALPEGVVREVRRAPPDVEPKILEKVAEEGLSVRETAALVNAVATRQVSVEEGLSEIKAEAPKKVAEAEEVKRAEHALFEKLAVLNKLFKLKYIEGIADSRTLAVRLQVSLPQLFELEKRLDEHLKGKIGDITPERLEFVCPECLNARVYFDPERNERVCGDCRG